MTTTDTTTSKPVKKVRIGSVSAAIWRQQEGFYTATLERSYKDKNGEWQSSQSFMVDDLIVVAKVAEKAADAILALQSNA